MGLERGTIRQINARGRVTVQLPDRLVAADIHSGSGGCVGDEIEGDMRLGVRSWRNVGTSVLSVVEVVASEPASDCVPALVPHDASMPMRRAGDRAQFATEARRAGWHRNGGDDQYSSRRFN